MPILPLDQSEPEMRVIAIMHYPEVNEENAEKIKAYVKANALQYEAPDDRQNWDHRLKKWSVEEGQREFRDFQKKDKRGTIAGALFATYVKLMIEEPERASWNLAFKTFGEAQKEENKHHSETYLKGLVAEFDTVLHLWAALHIRRGFHEDLSVGYTRSIDFQFFLFEAEILRYHARGWPKPVLKNTQNSTHPAPEGEPVIPEDAWRVPDEWQPPEKQPGWPASAGEIPYKLMPELPIPAEKRAGRPKKTDGKN